MSALLLRVLVVDDEPDTRDTLAFLLRARGHEVHLARDGPSALATAAAFRPQAVVLDIGLPGMNGWEVARRLREEAGLTDALLVAVTGHGREEDEARSRQAGFDAHLTKPAEWQALLAVLARAALSAGVP